MKSTSNVKQASPAPQRVTTLKSTSAASSAGRVAPARRTAQLATRNSPKISSFASLHSPGGNIAGTSLYEGSFTSHVSQSNTLMASGTERLQAITDVAGPAAAPYGNYLFNPLAVGSRLPLIATNFSKFRFKKLTVHYIPQISPANAAASGTVIMTADTDPEQIQPPSGDIGVNQLYSYDNKVVCPIVSAAKLDIDLDLKSQAQFLYCSGEGDPRNLYQIDLGIFRGNPTAGTSLTFGQVYFSYEIEFAQAIVDGAFGVNEAHGIGSYTSLTSSNVYLDFNPAATTNPFPNSASFDSGYGWGGNPDFLGFKAGAGPGGIGALVVAPGRYFVRAAYSAASTFTINVTNTTLLSAVQGTGVTIALVDSAPVFSTPTGLGFMNQTTNRYTAEYVWVLSAPTGCALSIAVPQTVASVSMFAMIQIYQCVLAAASGANLSPAQMKPKMANLCLAWDRQDADNLFAVRQVLKFDSELDNLPTTSDPALLVVQKCFGADVPDVLDPTIPMIAPAVAGVISWFIATYGPSLSKAALNWAVKQIESHYKKKR